MKVQALLICLAGCAGAISTPGSAPGQCAPYAGDKSGYATTTEFDDNATGACGCSNPGGLLSSGAGSPNKIVLAAGSQNLFGPTTWCGAGCGKCFELENVGAVAADKMGDCGGAGQKITVMLTDVCATSNAEWCSQPVNQYGFDTHFDIGRSAGELGWNNPVVKYQEVPCPGSIRPTYSGSCKCASIGSTSRVRRDLTGV